MGNMGITEWAILLVIILIFFGPKNLPKLAQSIGKSVRELKNGLNGIGEEIKETITTPPDTHKAETKSESVAAHEEVKKDDESHTTTV